MNTLSYKTLSVNKTTVKKEWLLIDVEGEILGRLSSKVSKLIRGKHKPYFTPHVDCGDNIVIINADKISLTGDKKEQKIYVRYSGYPGGRKEQTFKQALAKKPTFIIEKAVKGMLPKNKLGRALFKNLHVYANADHPHVVQKPREMKLKDIK